MDKEKILRLIEEDELYKAQAELDKSKEKSALHHFLQGEIYMAKKWYLEARKQFKLAVKKASPDEAEEYRAALEDLEAFSTTDEYKQYKKKRMGEGFGEALCQSCCGLCGLPL